MSELAPVIPIRPPPLPLEEACERVRQAKVALDSAKKWWDKNEVIATDAKAAMVEANNNYRLAVLELLRSVGDE